MAKYSRFDPRNRKYGRNKDRSLKKDIRIRNVDDDVRLKINKAIIREVLDEDNKEENV